MLSGSVRIELKPKEECGIKHIAVKVASTNFVVFTHLMVFLGGHKKAIDLIDLIDASKNVVLPSLTAWLRRAVLTKPLPIDSWLLS